MSEGKGQLRDLGGGKKTFHLNFARDYLFKEYPGKKILAFKFPARNAVAINHQLPMV